MGTKTNKEKDIDSDHPSTIRIIAGSLVLLCIFPIFGICVYECIIFWSFTLLESSRFLNTFGENY